MDCLSLTWSFVIDSKKVLIVGLTSSGSPVVLLRTLDNKCEFFIILADWLLLCERLHDLQNYFQQAAKKKTRMGSEEVKITGTHLNAITKEGKLLEMSYKSDWIDLLLSREPHKFILSVNEVFAVIKLNTQIKQALDIITKPSQSLIFNGLAKENLEEYLDFIIPNNITISHHQTSPPPQV